MPEPDWTALGRRLYLELGRIARETDLHGDEVYGEALRATLGREFVPRDEHEAMLQRTQDQARATARFDLSQAARAQREAADLVQRQDQALRGELAAELRQRAELLRGLRQRGMLEAAEFVWPVAAPRVKRADFTSLEWTPPVPDR